MLQRLTCLIATASLVTIALAGFAPARSPASGDKKGDNAQIVMELHHVVKTLGEAKKDYDGHRAKAVEEIHKAIKALDSKGDASDKGSKGEKGTKGTKGTKGDKGDKSAPVSKEDQAASDKLLTQARDKLKMLHGKLTGTTGAAADITAAIKELDAALKAN